MKSSSALLGVIILVAFGLAVLLASNFWEADTALEADNPETQDSQEPAHVESIAGTDMKSVVLTDQAAQRLDIKTVAVTTRPLAVPYAAVIYDVDGNTWVYVNPEPLVYVRHQIVVERITGDQAILSSGPPVGAAVVVRGAAELYGSESEFEEE